MSLVSVNGLRLEKLAGFHALSIDHRRGMDWHFTIGAEDLHGFLALVKVQNYQVHRTSPCALETGPVSETNQVPDYRVGALRFLSELTMFVGR